MFHTRRRCLNARHALPMNEPAALASKVNKQENDMKNTSLVLAKGQLWKMQDAYIQIVELGKRLIHYKMMKELGQMRVKTQMSGIESMGLYLKNNRARLVKQPAS